MILALAYFIQQSKYPAINSQVGLVGLSMVTLFEKVCVFEVQNIRWALLASAK
jgi:hypothetical protein